MTSFQQAILHEKNLDHFNEDAIRLTDSYDGIITLFSEDVEGDIVHFWIGVQVMVWDDQSKYLASLMKCLNGLDETRWNGGEVEAVTTEQGDVFMLWNNVNAVFARGEVDLSRYDDPISHLQGMVDYYWNIRQEHLQAIQAVAEKHDLSQNILHWGE